MTKCQVYQCKNQSTWTWQPCGPAETPNCFVLPGNHYRGFAAIHICDDCKEKYENSNNLTFSYKNQLFTADKEKVTKNG